MLQGKKAYIGAAIVALSAGLRFLGYDASAQVLEALGLALGVAGIRAKQARTDAMHR